MALPKVSSWGASYLVATLSSPHPIPWFFPEFPTEALIFIKPSEVYRQAYMYSGVNIVALLAVHLVHVNFTYQYSGYVYSTTVATEVVHNRQTTKLSKFLL